MRNSPKERECFHKIKFFQYHSDCDEYACLCENKCQALHASNGAVYTLPIASVQEKHQKIKNKLVLTLKGFTDSFKKRYEEIIEGFHKRSGEILREMEKELLGELMKCISVSRDVLEKIENSRMDRLKCSEIFSFYSDEEYENKLRDIQLTSIYDKHFGLFLQTYKNFNWDTSPEMRANSTQQQSKSLQDSHKKAFQKEFDELKAQHFKMRQKNIQLESQLQFLRQKSQLTQKKLARKSWTIAIVRLKRKEKKQAKGLPTQATRPQEYEFQGMSAPHLMQAAQRDPNQLMDAEDSQDIFQFQARQKR